MHKVNYRLASIGGVDPTRNDSDFKFTFLIIKNRSSEKFDYQYELTEQKKQMS